MTSRFTRLVLVGLLLCFARAPAHAYNDGQHQGMVALAYKAMAASVLEKGCSSPAPFGLDSPPSSLRELPEGLPCGEDLAACLERWQHFVGEVDKAVPLVQRIRARLPAGNELCPVPDLGPGSGLEDVLFAVNPHYGRDRGHGCGLDACSSLDLACSDSAVDIFRYLVPDDHTGDVLGYWATEPDHDKTLTAIGFKPVNGAFGGVAISEINDRIEDVAFAVAIPFLCALEFLFGGDDCLDAARSLADDAVPIEDVSSLVPVFGPQDSGLFTGLWHFIQTGTPASNECDDLQGVLYTEAGPGRPDEVDLGFGWLADFAGLTVSYDESAGTRLFNITDPNDGDAPSCERGRVEWEFESFPHIPFSPIDNLALYGWRIFAGTAPADWSAKDLGWPLHAIGDAVAPHHVVGTTGWGHRPYEDAAEESWRKILHHDTSANDVLEVQYEQLRRILIWAYSYSLVFDELRSTRPSGTPQNEVPIRAFVTRVATDTRDEVFSSGTGSPPWPYEAGVSVPYALPNTLELGDRDIAKALYGDDDSVGRTRALLERGAGATLAFLAELPRLQPSQPTGDPVCPKEGVPGSQFSSCGELASCVEGCCVHDDEDD
jgi:hypothetical protein